MSKFGMRMIAAVGLAAVALWAAVPAQAKGDKPAGAGAKHGEHVSGALTKNADGTIKVGDQTLTVCPKCKFKTADGKADATLADFKDGDVVTIGYTKDGDKLVAKFIGVKGAGHGKKK